MDSEIPDECTKCDADLTNRTIPITGRSNKPYCPECGLIFGTYPEHLRPSNRKPWESKYDI